MGEWLPIFHREQALWCFSWIPVRGKRRDEAMAHLSGRPLLSDRRGVARAIARRNSRRTLLAPSRSLNRVRQDICEAGRAENRGIGRGRGEAGMGADLFVGFGTAMI